MKTSIFLAFALLIAASSAQFHLDLGARLDLAGGIQTVAAGETVTISGRINCLVGFVPVDTGFGASLTVTNKGQSSATFKLYSALSSNFDLGFNLASVIPSAAFGFNVNLGLGFESTLEVDQFTAVLVLTPPTFTATSQTQLFLVANGTTSGSFFASQQTNVIGAIPALIVGQSVSFSLHTAPISTYIAASLSFNANTAAFPCLFGVAASVRAGVQTALNFGAKLAVDLNASANLQFQASVAAAASIQADAQLQISGGLSGRIYTDLNAFYTVDTASEDGEESSDASFTAGLSFKLAAGIAADACSWGRIAADGTVTLIASANLNGKLTASVNAVGQYGVFIGSLVANGTFESKGASLSGGASFDVRFLLAGFAVSGGSSLAVTSTLGAINYVCPFGLTQFTSTGYKLSASVTNTGASGKISLYAVALAGVQGSIGINGAFDASEKLTLSYGLQIVTDLEPGTFSLNVTLTPPSFSASANVQLYYFLDANGLQVSGNAKGSFAVAVPALPAFNGAVTFTLPSIHDSTYLLGSISISKGITIAPAAFGLAVSVQAKVETALAFGGNLFVKVNSAVKTAFQAAFSASFAGSVNFGASASASAYTSLNAFYHFNVTDQTSLSADLVFAVNKTDLALRGIAAKSLCWVYIAVDGSASVLATTSTVDVSGNLAISATTNHFSTYAVYSSPQYNNDATTGQTGQLTAVAPSSSSVVSISAMLFVIATFLAL